MNLSDDKVERLRRLHVAWAEAERAIKIADQTVGDVVIPAVKELRYAGRKLSKSLDNYLSDTNLTDADRWLEDAINDCFRARHDATDAATAFIAIRLELAVKRVGTEAIRECFPGYPDLRGRLATVRRKVADARKDHNGRHDIYDDLEADELPKIMELYETFLANETDMKNKRLMSWLIQQGINLGWVLAMIIAVIGLVVAL